jgi:hypothetical protein
LRGWRWGRGVDGCWDGVMFMLVIDGYIQVF